MPRFNRSAYGRPHTKSDGTYLAASVATLTELKTITTGDSDLIHGNEMFVDADGSCWVYNSTSTLTGDDILVVAPTGVTTGRWLRKVGHVALRLPFSFSTADGATLLTIPAGCVFKLDSTHWDITADMTGGSSSAIGIAGTNNTTAGDLLGGASGDVAATLVAGVKAGTIGAKMDTVTELHAQLFVATNTITFERINSAFTAGSGYAVLVGRLVKNAGA